MRCVGLAEGVTFYRLVCIGLAGKLNRDDA